MAAAQRILPDFSSVSAAEEDINTPSVRTFVPLQFKEESSNSFEPLDNDGQNSETAEDQFLNPIPHHDEPTPVTEPMIALNEHQAALEDLQEKHHAEMEEMVSKIRWDFIDSIETFRTSIFSTVSSELGDIVFRVLKPLLQKHMSEVAVQSFVRELMTIVGDEKSQPLVVRGPQELLDLLGEELSDVPFDVHQDPDESLELSVQLDDIALTTQIEEWTQKLGAGQSA